MDAFPQSDYVRGGGLKRMGGKLAGALASKELKENLALAEEVKHYACSHIQFSSNNLARSQLLKDMKAAQDPELRDAISAVELSIDTIRALKLSWEKRHPDQVGTINEMIHGAIIAERYRVGNCEEITQTGCKYILDHRDEEHIRDKRVEMFAIVGSDHRFMVIGRPEDSDPNDVRTWKDAAINDAWIATVSPARSQLFGIFGYDPKLGHHLMPVLEIPRFGADPHGSSS